MKKIIILSICCLMSFMGLQAENNFKFQIKGPLKKYNTIRVINQSNYENISCTIFLLKQEGEKMVVASTLATCALKLKGDTDTKEYVKVNQDEWIGVKLDDKMENTTVSIDYKNYPFVNMVELTILDESAPASGVEF